MAYFQDFRQKPAKNDAITSHRKLGDVGRYYSVMNTDSLHQGRISVTHTACANHFRGDSGELAYELNRRQTCLRASKLSLHSASSQSSQHVAVSKKKKWLLLSQWSKSPHTANSNTFAGRTIARAPQNLFRSACRVELTFPKFRSDAFMALFGLRTLFLRGRTC